VKKGRTAERIGNLLAGVFRGLGLDGKIEEMRLRDEWPRIVGEAVSRRCRPRCVKRGTLIIDVDNNVWMQEIRFHQTEMLGKIEQLFPKLGVTGIRLELTREKGRE
jgi:predicted nucleic acid-binding Zn ribbon protein